MKAHGGCGCKGAHTYVYIATALAKSRVASPTLGCLYPRCSFYSRLSRPQEQSGHEEVKKIFTPPTPGIEPGPLSPAAWATWPPKKSWLEYNHPFPTLKKHILIVTSPLWLWTNAFPSFCKTTMPTTLFMSQKKHFLFEFEKLRQYSCWKAITSALVFRRAWFTTPLLQPLFAIRKIVSVTYGLQAGVSSACRGEDNIPLLQTQRWLVSNFIQTQINVWKIPLK